MSKLFCVGDTHGAIDFQKLIDFKDKFGSELTKNDYLMIAGDFGIIWEKEPDAEEIALLDWLDMAPWTTLFIDGNHENHPRLNSFPETVICGGRAHQISKTVYHIMRGEVIEIEDLTLLCMGGADSHDKQWRTPGESWWKEERITEADIQNARDNLERYNFCVDFVISHSLPQSIHRRIYPYMKPTRSCHLLDDIFWDVDINKSWISGHYHDDFTKQEQEGVFRLIYEDIIMLYTKENI